MTIEEYKINKEKVNYFGKKLNLDIILQKDEINVQENIIILSSSWLKPKELEKLKKHSLVGIEIDKNTIQIVELIEDPNHYMTMGFVRVGTFHIAY